MKTTYLPSGVQSILFSFRSCFSERVFENFTALVCGWILCPGTHTISRALVTARAQGLAGKGHSAYYRFFSQARWSADEVCHVLFRLLLPFFPENIEAAVDDTLCHRAGPHLFGAGMHHDSAKSTYGGKDGARASFAFGHNWVVLSLWAPYPWNRDRGIALPVLLRLYRSKKLCPKAQYRKRTELAAEMLTLLCSWLPEGRTLDLAGDGEYACKTLLRDLPPNVVFTGPMLMDAALFARPLKRGGRGRPRFKGDRLASPAQRARRGKWKKTEVRMYDRDVTILIQSFICLWYTVRGTHLVRVVITRDPRGRWKDRAYFCTDAKRSPEMILARYAHRWLLEVTFQAAKQVLGLEEPRNGWWRRDHDQPAASKKAGPNPNGDIGRRAVERTVPFIFVVYGIVTIWFFKHGNAHDVAQRQRKAKPWYGLKKEPAYGDMVAALRREFWGQRINRYPSLRRHRSKIIHLIESFGAAA